MSVSGSSQPLALVSPHDWLREVAPHSRVTIDGLFAEIETRAKRYESLAPDDPERVEIVQQLEPLFKALFWKRALSNSSDTWRAEPVYIQEEDKLVFDGIRDTGQSGTSELTETITAWLAGVRKAAPQVFTDHIKPEVTRAWIQTANDIVRRLDFPKST